jgi:hypothetical protein
MAGPSTYYKKYFVNGNVDYIGQCHRVSVQVAKEVVNSSYVKFCREKELPLPTGYRMVFSNMDASFKSVSKYDKGQPKLCEGGWALAEDWTISHFYPYMCNSRILSTNMVLSEMDMGTSCGYPANIEYQNKRDLIGLSNVAVELQETPSWSDALDAVSNTSKAFPILEDFWILAGTENSDNICPIWSCCQKIELRAIKKLEVNDHRTYLVAPIEHSVATNRLCLDMNNKFYNSNGKTWSFVGGTKYLSGWDRLYRRLNKHPNAFELDESQYDSSLFSRAMMGMVDIRWSFLANEEKSPENRLRLEAVYESIVHSVIVLENGELIQKHTGNPSGSSNTIVDNTIILYRLFAYAWIVLCNQLGKKAVYSEFTSEVEAALNGDDNTFTVSDACVSWFNPTAIAAVWTNIGITTKTPCWESRPLREVTFLSQGFDYDQSLRIWLPVPDTQKVLSTLCYGANIDDVRFHLLRANALRLDSYGNILCRRIISDYINFLYERYMEDLIGNLSIKKADIPMSEIFGLWKSDAYIEALYSGYEGDSGACEATPFLLVVGKVKTALLL